MTNEFTRNLETFTKFQEDFLRKSNEVSKQVAVEALKNAKKLNETFAQHLDEQIKQLSS